MTDATSAGKVVDQSAFPFGNSFCGFRSGREERKEGGVTQKSSAICYTRVLQVVSRQLKVNSFILSTC